MEEKMSFGDFLQKRRSSMMRQKVLAEKIGITVSYLCEIENGRKDPPQYDLVVKIADELNLKGHDREMFVSVQVCPEETVALKGDGETSSWIMLRKR